MIYLPRTIGKRSMLASAIVLSVGDGPDLDDLFVPLLELFLGALSFPPAPKIETKFNKQFYTS